MAFIRFLIVGGLGFVIDSWNNSSFNLFWTICLHSQIAGHPSRNGLHMVSK